MKNCFFCHLTSKLNKIAFLKDIFDKCLLTRCQKKGFSQKLFFRKRQAAKNQVTSVLWSTLDSCYWRDLHNKGCQKRRWFSIAFSVQDFVWNPATWLMDYLSCIPLLYSHQRLVLFSAIKDIKNFLFTHVWYTVRSEIFSDFLLFENNLEYLQAWIKCKYWNAWHTNKKNLQFDMKSSHSKTISKYEKTTLLSAIMLFWPSQHIKTRLNIRSDRISW